MNRAARKTDPKPIDYSILPELLGYQLRLSQIAVFRDFADSAGDSRISPSLFGVLVILDANPGLKQTELAEAVRLDRSTVVSVIDKLERQQLVQRKRVEGDRRTNALALTAEGQALLKQLLPRIREHDQRISQELSGDERETLIRLLAKVLPDSR